MAFLPVIIVFLLYFSGIPIAYALFASSLFYFGVLNTGSPTDLILQKFITSTQSFPLLAIPFFVMAGSIMNYAGISTKLMSFADVLTGHLPGGLAQVNVLLSMLMGGVSGSANADAAMQCKMLVPEMEKRGYSKGFSAAITAASSAVTPVIPPGINLIVYALIAGRAVRSVRRPGKSAIRPLIPSGRFYSRSESFWDCVSVCLHRPRQEPWLFYIVLLSALLYIRISVRRIFRSY